MSSLWNAAYVCAILSMLLSVASGMASPASAIVTMPMFGIVGEMTTSANISEGVNVTAMDLSFNADVRAWREYSSLGEQSWYQLSVLDGVIRTVNIKSVCSNANSDSQFQTKLNVLYSAIGGNELINKDSIQLTGSAMVRGKVCWVLECSSCLPVGQVSGGYTIQWFFESTEHSVGKDSDYGPLRVLKITFDNADSIGSVLLQVDVAWISTAVPVEELQLLMPCITVDTGDYTLGDSPKVQSRTVMVPQSTEFPSLPSTFRAYVEVTFLNQTSFVLHEEFSPILQFARTTQRGLYKDVAGRRVDMENEVDGATSLVYQSITRSLAYKSVTSLPEKMINYFFDSDFECSKNLFGSTIVADSVGSLLLKDSAYATYMGAVANLRGYPLAYYWQSDVNYGGGFVVEWYFDSPDVDGRLLRMVIKGTGTPPFFPHRPFFQLPSAIPDQYAQIACESLAGARGCYEELEDTAITYDFYGVGPLEATFSSTPVTGCQTTADYNAFPPPTSCTDASSAGDTFVFFLISAFIGALIGGLIVYWRVRARFFAFLAFEEERRAVAAATASAAENNERTTAAAATAEASNEQANGGSDSDDAQQIA